MSRNFAIFEKAGLEASLSSPVAQQPVENASGLGEYLELVRRLFDIPSAVAMIGVGVEATGVCKAIATELSSLGERVVIVGVEALLRSNRITIPNECDFIPTGRIPNVWLWPSSREREFFRTRETETADHWLNSLRSNFDSILLDCPPMNKTPGVAEVAAMADATVLVVKAGHTKRPEIQIAQRALQMRDVRLAGCVLIRRT